MSPRGCAIAVYLVAVTALPAIAHAGTGLAAARVPLSARQQAGGGPCGEYDVLGLPANPAMLAAQPGWLDLNATAGFLLGSAERALGLGAGWKTGVPEELEWGLAAVAGQVSAAGFDAVDDVGNPTGERVSPATRRIDAVAACRLSWLAAGAAVGTVAESYGNLADGLGSGPSGMRGSAGVLALFPEWRAGAAFRFQSGDTGAPDILDAGASAGVWGLRLAGNVSVPLAGPAGPAFQAGFNWPVSPAFDLRAAYGASLAPDTGLSSGSSARLGLTVRSKAGLAMDYSIQIPFSSGLGVTHLIAFGKTFGTPARIP